MDSNCFFELLQVAAGTREALAHVPATEEEWVRLFRDADAHAMLGVTFPALEKVGKQVEVPLYIYISWEKAAREIQLKNKGHRHAVAEVYRTFIDNGFHACILKGQVTAVMYPQADLRQNGDIDIWVDGGREKVMDYLKLNFTVFKTRYIHANVKMTEKFRVEVHFTPSWMFSPLGNRRLQKWFSEQAPRQFDNYDESLQASIPTLRFNGVYMMLHIYRHLLEEGVGLRQLMDYYFLLRHLDEEDRRVVVQDLRRLGLLRFAGAVMQVLSDVFLLDEKDMLCPPSPRKGRFLMEEVLVSGNFGRTDPVFANSKSRKEGILAHGWRKIKRNLRFLQLCPSEVLWMPFFVTWQYFWRRKYGYLYKGR